MTPFEQALAFTLKEEGGYVCDPHDRGGATNCGITRGVYDTWRHSKGIPERDIKDIEPHEVQAIYQSLYWIPGHCGELTPRLSVVHFDWCVNHGVPGAIKSLQLLVGVEPDCIWGPKTAKACEEGDKLCYAYVNRRRAWYTNFIRSHPEQGKFAVGWYARCDRLLKYIDSI